MKKVLPTKKEFLDATKLAKSTLGAAKILGVHFDTYKKYTITYGLDTSHHDRNSEFHVKYAPVEMSAKRTWERRYSEGNLTLPKFIELSQLSCWYCGLPPSNVSNWYKGDKRSRPERVAAANFIYNGLDRIDNCKPHDTDNLVPCCFICNTAKMEMSLEEFK